MGKSHCLLCGRAFTPNRSDQLYCSKRCRLRSYRSEVPIIQVSAEVFHRIASGDQTEVYRKITPYWTNKFENLFNKVLDITCIPPKWVWNDHPQPIRFQNYTKNEKKYINAICSIREGIGEREWDAEPEKKYYILTIHQIFR